MTSEADWERGIARTLEELGGLEVVVNNAGIEISALVVDLDPEELRRMLDVNVVGVALGMKHGLRAMRPGGRGGRWREHHQHLLGGGHHRLPGHCRVLGTKSAVDRMTRVAAQESGRLGYGVRVNCIYPGLVPTAMGVGLAESMVKPGAGAQRGSGRPRRHPDAARPARRSVGHGGVAAVFLPRKLPVITRMACRGRRHGHVRSLQRPPSRRSCDSGHFFNGRTEQAISLTPLEVSALSRGEEPLDERNHGGAVVGGGGSRVDGQGRAVEGR